MAYPMWCVLYHVQGHSMSDHQMYIVDQILYFHKIIETDFNDITGAWLLFEVLPDVIIVSSKWYHFIINHCQPCHMHELNSDRYCDSGLVFAESMNVMITNELIYAQQLMNKTSVCFTQSLISHLQLSPTKIVLTSDTVYLHLLQQGRLAHPLLPAPR